MKPRPDGNKDEDAAGGAAPTVGALTHHNIESILRLEEEERQTKPWLYRVVAHVANRCGTVTFLWVNFVAFAVWIGFNQLVFAFDPYPFTFLVLVVSLEAIFLSILILISQNMSAEENERRHHLDLQINLLDEREMTALLRLVAQIGKQVGVEAGDQREVRALAQKTDPGAVLHQIVAAEAAHDR